MGSPAASGRSSRRRRTSRRRSRRGTRRPSRRRAAIDLRSGAELAAEFDALRTDGLALVRGLRPVELARLGNHPEVGPLRVDELLGEWVHHDRNHVRQMLAVSQARVWPQMGNARRFFLAEL